MSSAIFVDTNVPIYAGGLDHPLRLPCLQILNVAAAGSDAFVTDAEVLQEILHRYVAIRAWQRGLEVFEGFSDLMEGRIEPMYASDVQDAASLTERYPALSARDLIHLAVMQRLGVTRIASADRGFDGIEGVERLDPARFDQWRDSVIA